MQTFDGELEKLILSGAIDKETGLSYATNRTNLQLKLSTQAAGEESPPIKAATAPPPSRGRGRPEMEDLIER